MKEAGRATARTALKDRKETTETKEKLGEKIKIPQQLLCKITILPAEQMQNSSLGIFPEGFRSL